MSAVSLGVGCSSRPSSATAPAELGQHADVDEGNIGAAPARIIAES
jgi:hypothetical protein